MMNETQAPVETLPGTAALGAKLAEARRRREAVATAAPATMIGGTAAQVIPLRTTLSSNEPAVDHATARDVATMRSTFPPKLRGKTLADFDANPDTNAADRAREFVSVCDRWFTAGRPEDVPGPVVFFTSERHGEVVAPGNGKSLLAVGILEAIAAQGWLSIYRHERTGEQWPNLVFVTTVDLISEIRACYSPSSARTVEEVIGRYLAADVLVLDDVGTEPAADDAVSRLFILLDKRRRPTVFTSNYSPKQLSFRMPEWAKLISRVRERLRGAVLTGPDRRVPEGDPWAHWK